MKEEVVNVGELIRHRRHHEMCLSCPIPVSPRNTTPSPTFGGGGRRRYDPPGHGEPDFNAVRYTPEWLGINAPREEGRHHAPLQAATPASAFKEEARMVFSRLARRTPVATAESGGLGAGLAVVKEIVDRHGGCAGGRREAGKGAPASPSTSCCTTKTPSSTAAPKKRTGHKKLRENEPIGELRRSASFAASKQRRGDPDGAIYGIAGRLTIEMDKNG